MSQSIFIVKENNIINNKENKIIEWNADNNTYANVNLENIFNLIDNNKENNKK